MNPSIEVKKDIFYPLRIGKKVVKTFLASSNTRLENEFIKKLGRYKVKWQPRNRNLILSQEFADYTPCLHLAYLCKKFAEKENANVGVYSVMGWMDSKDYSSNTWHKRLCTEINYKKLDRVYLSYAGKVIYRNIYHYRLQNVVESVFAEIRKTIHSKEDVINIQVEGIKIGDLVYDTYLRFYSKATVDIHNPLLDHVIKQALDIFFNFKELLKKYNVKGLVNMYTTYIHSGIFVRLCLKNNIPVYTTGSHNSIVNRVHDYYPSHFSPHFLYKKLFDSLDKKEECLEEAKLQFEKRFKGEKDDAISYMRINAFSKEYDSALTKYDWSKTVVVLAHCMFDSPHVYRQLLFPDFFEWLVFTLDTLSHNKDITVLVKQHPNGLEGNNEIFEGLKNKYAASNIVFINKSTSNQQIMDSKPIAVVTAHGTAGAEFTYFNIPVVNLFDNPYTAFSFTHTGHSIQQYGDLLSRVGTLPNINNRNDILAHYYMHHIYFMQNVYKDYMGFIDYKGDTYSDAFLASYLPKMTENFLKETEAIKLKGLNLIDWMEEKQIN